MEQHLQGAKNPDEALKTIYRWDDLNTVTKSQQVKNNGALITPGFEYIYTYYMDVCRYLILYKIRSPVGLRMFAFWFQAPCETTSHSIRSCHWAGAETYCFWPHNCPFPLVWKPGLAVLWKKKKRKSPTIVTVPKEYKKTNPDARIWSISSAMWLCPLTEGEKNITEL